MNYLKYVYIVVILAFATCGLSVEKRIIGDFYLVAIDTKEQMSVSYRLSDGDYIGLVNEHVFAVGHNQQYIVVKQYVDISDDMTASQLNFYIVKSADFDPFRPEKNVCGPLSVDQYKLRAKELNITGIEFVEVR